MQETSGRRRRVPPRSNPDPTPKEAPPGFRQQVSEVPWSIVILTTAVTTVAGYLTIEGIRSLHGAFRRRREAAALAENAKAIPEAAPLPVGIQSDGSFRLMGPGDTNVTATRFGPQPEQTYAPSANHSPAGPTSGQVHYELQTLNQRLANLERAIMAGRGAA